MPKKKDRLAKPAAPGDGAGSPAAGSTSSRRLSFKRRWLFRLSAATLVPLCLLVLLELILRLAGFGYPTTFTTACKVQDQHSYCENYKFSYLYFPRHLARVPASFVIPAEKPSGTYRIFVLGGSAAMGEPDSSLGFHRILELMLRDQYPAARFEVVNAAMTAINSHVALRIARDCAQRQPDLFVVYMGNNEVVGPYGPGTVYAPMSPSLSVIRASIAAKSTRLGQLLQGLLRRLTPSPGTLTHWAGMEQFLDKQVRRSDSGLQKAYDHFKQNIEDICSAARDSGAKVVLCTVATNVKDCAPFASLHRRDIGEEQQQQWDRSYRKGIEYQAKDSPAEAVSHYLRAAEIDGDFAELHYRLGCCYRMLGDHDRANRSFADARDLDTLRFRADAQINNIIRQVARAKSNDAYLLDIEEVFQQNSAHGQVGSELLHEHVHLNFRGNYILARSLLGRIQDMLPTEIRELRHKSSELLTQEQCETRMAFTIWDRHRIADAMLNRIQRPPFTQQFAHAEHVRRKQQDLQKLSKSLSASTLADARMQYEQALDENETDWQLRLRYVAFLLNALRGDSSVEDHLRQVLRQVPQCVAAHSNLGQLLAFQRRHDEACSEFRAVLRLAPSACPEAAFAHDSLGDVLVSMHKLDEAAGHYLTSLAIAEHPAAHFKLGKIMAAQDRWDRAIKHYSRAVELKGDFMPAQRALDEARARRSLAE